MIHTQAFQRYVASPGFLERLGLPEGTALDISPLAQGEYNANFRFCHPGTGQPLVLRVNTGSQMHLEHQIVYEYAALRDLLPSGRTPRPLFCDDSREILPYGVLVMEWLPGRALRYESDLPQAAEILADIHAVPVPRESGMLRPRHPLGGVYDECLEMVEKYLSWEGAEVAVCRLLEALVVEIGRMPLTAPSDAPRCMVNTELNSGNFLINPGGKSYLVDWEKPLLSEPAQDLGHFLAPTTTYWKTDTILTPEEVAGFTDLYRRAVGDRMDTSALKERLPLFFTVTCLRGVTWCAMALVEYSRPGRPLTNPDTYAKIREYVSEDFLRNILERYVRRNFLGGGAAD